LFAFEIKMRVDIGRHGYEGKSALMIFDKYPQQRKGDRHFWARGYYVDTVGLNEEQVKQYIKNQERSDTSSPIKK
jgi:putative transposase